MTITAHVITMYPDYGLGNSYMMNLSTQDCPNGELLSYAGKNVLCKQVGAR